MSMQYKNNFFGLIIAHTGMPATIFTGKLFWFGKDGITSSGPSINIVLLGWLFRFIVFTEIERG